MSTDKEAVKKWLKSIGKDRFWLASKCNANKKTVDRWLSSARGVPSKAALVIQSLMKNEAAPKYTIADVQKAVSNILTCLSPETLKLAEAEALRHGISLSEYCALAVEFCSDNKVKITNNPVDEAKSQGANNFDNNVIPFELPKLRIIGNIAAGNFIHGDTEPYDIQTSKQFDAGFYGLKACGNSMEPHIRNDDFAVIKPWTDSLLPKFGEVVVYSDGRGVTLKRIIEVDGEPKLVSFNPAYNDIDPIDGGMITGVLKGIVRKDTDDAVILDADFTI